MSNQHYPIQVQDRLRTYLELKDALEAKQIAADKMRVEIAEMAERLESIQNDLLEWAAQHSPKDIPTTKLLEYQGRHFLISALYHNIIELVQETVEKGPKVLL